MMNEPAPLQLFFSSRGHTAQYGLWDLPCKVGRDLGREGKEKRIEEEKERKEKEKDLQPQRSTWLRGRGSFPRTPAQLSGVWAAVSPRAQSLALGL